MQLLQAQLSIRGKQLIRAFLGLSWYNVIVLGTTAAFLLLWIYQKLQELPFAALAVAGGAAMILLLHISRSDKRFVQHLAVRYQLLFWAEYTVLLAPLHILLLLAGQWLFILPLEALLLSISYLKVKPLYKTKARHYTFIHRHNFEWKSGLRKNFWLFALLYTFGVALAPFPFAILVVLWLLLVLVSSFYQECESYTLLLLSERGPRQFLKYKIRLQVLQYMVLTLPLLFLHLFFQPAHALLTLAAHAMLLLVLISSVLLKYAHYEPNEKVTSAAALLNALNLASPLLPFLLLFPIISSFRNYNKAIHRLKPFLHDFDS